MLISALCKYYDTLAANGLIDTEGFAEQIVTFMIMLNPDGSVADIVDYVEEIKTETKKGVSVKKVGRIIKVPVHPDSSSVLAYLLDFRSDYIFGFDVDNKVKSIFFYKQKHDAFVEKNLQFIEGIDSPIVNAYRNFLENWTPPENVEGTIYKRVIGSKCCFALNGHPEIQLQNDSQIVKKCSEQYSNRTYDDCTIGTCAITGAPNQSIMSKHGVIKGIRNTKMNPKLVCFNNPSDESYGKRQSANSSISAVAAEKYAAALNWILRTDGHHTYLDDLTLAYWADTDNVQTDSAVCDIFSFFCTDNKADREETENRLSSVMAKARVGEISSVDLSAEGIDPSVNFYIAGFTPNSSRVSLKFIYRNTIAGFIKNIAQHQRDLMHDGLDKNKQIPVLQLMNVLFPPKTEDRKPPYPLYSAFMQSILNGTRYPQSLLGTVIQRCKTDGLISGKIGGTRIALIKACLNRKARILNKQEVISMSLDTENNSTAYVCGRIFALLEYAQRNASKTKLDRTIKDAYFSSACSRPASVFPRLMMLAQHHLEKAENGGYINKLISEAVDKLDGKFPPTLSLDEQGEFIIGYYQQNKSLYTKAEK